MDGHFPRVPSPVAQQTLPQGLFEQMEDLLASFLGSDPEELARQAVACGRSDDLERFSTEVLHHVRSGSTTAAATVSTYSRLSTPAAGAAATASAVPAVTPSYEGIGLLEYDEMATYSDEEGDDVRAEESRKPAAAATATPEQNDDDNNHGDGDEDSVATVPRPMPMDDDGEEVDTEVAAPAPVTSAAAEAANSTAAAVAAAEPGAKFQVGERVICLARNPALAARGRYEAKILQVGPKTEQSGRCRKSKFEYSVRYDGYGSDWDEWLPESSVEERNDETLKLVARNNLVRKRKAKAKRVKRAPRRNSASEGMLPAVAQRQRSTTKRKRGNTDTNNREDAPSDIRRPKKRTKRKRRETSEPASSQRAQSTSSSGIPSTNNELVRSVGRTRDELNTLDRSSDFRRMKEKTGIFAKFGMASVATKGGSVSHIVMNDEWNKIVTCRDEMQDLEFGLGAGRARAAELLAKVDNAGIPFFHAPKIAEQTNKIFYIGHWAPVQSETVKYRRPKTFMGKPRQMRIRLKFVKYDKKINKMMRDGRL